MWISWVSPKTHERERIYNYYDQADATGAEAIRVARRALAQRFGISEDDIPGFRIERAPWLALPVFRRLAREDAESSKRTGPDRYSVPTSRSPCS